MEPVSNSLVGYFWGEGLFVLMNVLAQMCFGGVWFRGGSRYHTGGKKKNPDSWEDPSNESGIKCHKRSHQQRDGKGALEKGRHHLGCVRSAGEMLVKLYEIV